MKNRFLSMLIVLSTMCMHSYGQNDVAKPMADVNGVVDLTLDSINLVRTMRPKAGSSRVGDNPVLFLVGNSTMRTGTKGNGDNGQWGWGYFAQDLFDPAKITVENHALGGTSSRTFYRRLWPEVVEGVKEGDWVIIELGHNDNGPYDEGRARASIPGIGKDSLNVVIKETGEPETVYTYGEYLRRMIRETKAKGGRPVLMSLTPRKAFVDEDSTIVQRVNNTFGLWAMQVAEHENVPFVDLNEITAKKFEAFGKEKVKTMFYIDNIHTSEFGAKVNAESAAEGIRQNAQLAELADMLLPVEEDKITGSTRKGNNPVIFIIGDSTVKYSDSDGDKDNGCGWGSMFSEFVDLNKATVENHAKAGRSARTFMDEGRWDKVYKALKPGDIVLMQFGHNDIGDINKGKARGELTGAGGESKVFKMEATGKNQVVYTYGWYLRKMIYDILEKGAIPVVVTPTPRNMFDNGKIDSFANSFCAWAKNVADNTGAYYIDLNSLAGAKYQKIALTEGLDKLMPYYFKDHTHTSVKGARTNAQTVVEALKQTNCPINRYLKKIIKK